MNTEWTTHKKKAAINISDFDPQPPPIPCLSRLHAVPMVALCYLTSPWCRRRWPLFNAGYWGSGASKFDGWWGVLSCPSGQRTSKLWEKYIEYMDVSKNRGTPKWMVYHGKPYFLMDDLGVPLFFETPIWWIMVIWFVWDTNEQHKKKWDILAKIVQHAKVEMVGFLLPNKDVMWHQFSVYKN